VRLVQSSLTTDEMASLIASVDIVVSLHRAEGFGLIAAEAMWLGRAIVATGWSGVMDFLDSETAELVDYQLVSVASTKQDIYSRGVWAEPLIADAAARLRHLIDDPQFRAARGILARARADAILAEGPWLARTFTMFAVGEADCDAFSSAARSFENKLGELSKTIVPNLMDA
jgi:glycosyltransferase involved in cell wall biosynthesis